MYNESTKLLNEVIFIFIFLTRQCRGEEGDEEEKEEE
jgi:hypothetical protein